MIKHSKKLFKIPLYLLMIGNAFEYYDFFLCSFFISILSPLFFQASNHLESLMMGFAFIGTGFIARPFGALFFGYLGDKIGRKHALIKTLYLMAFSTLSIGFLPTYNEIGLCAPLLLVILRLLQGFAIGGEVNGSAIAVLELSPDSNKGFIGSLVSSSAGIGSIFATLFGLLFMNDWMPEWSWRALFILGGCVALIALYLRQSLPELNFQKTLASPLSDVIGKYPVPFVKAIGIGFFLYCSFYILAGCVNPMLHAKGKIDRLTLILIDAGLVFFSTLISPIFGYFSDKIGQRKMMIIGAIGQMIFALPFFLAYRNGNILEIWIMSIFLMFFAQLFNAPSNAYLNSFFPPQCRYTGVSFGTCIGIAISGGITPAVCSYFLETSFWAPSIFLAICSFVGLISVTYSAKQGLRLPSLAKKS